MKIFCTSLLLSITILLFSQESRLDNPVPIFNIQVHYAGQWPEKDMKTRFGFNSAAGGGLSYKTKSNWIFEGDYSYLFGKKVNINDYLFNDISTKDGFIIDGNGQLAEVYTYERGFYAILGIGKILPILQINDNSGVTISAGAGFLQHKIRVYNPDNTAPQVCNDYVKGYDHLSNGPALKQFIGYSFYGVQKVYSFKIGFEIVEAFTKCRRDFVYPLKGPDNNKRLDVLYGFKVIWTLPFYQNTKSDIHYYY